MSMIKVVKKEMEVEQKGEGTLFKENTFSS